MVQQELLVDLLNKSADQAMPMIYDQYHEALYGIILRIVKDDNYAQNILQDVFVKTWQNRASYDSQKGRLFTWMMRIARNLSINHINSKGHRINAQFRSLDEKYRIESNIKIVEDTIDTHDLLGNLDEKYRKIIELVYFQGYTQVEISDKLDMPLGSVKSSIRIGLRKLRSIYDGDKIRAISMVFIYLFSQMV